MSEHERLKRTEILNRVNKINTELQNRGLDWDEILDFWEECFQKAEKKKLQQIEEASLEK